MKDNIKNKKKIINVLFAVVLIAQVVFLIFNFMKKDDFHSDELWSYGFAASSDGPHLFMTDDEQFYKNFFEWKDCEVLKDYIVVNKDEIFDYVSVYNNCASDIHPPLFFMLLHFVLSVFSGTWSSWYAFAINLAAFIMLQFFLRAIINKITGDEVYGLLSVAYFGFTMGTVNMFIYLRNYALGAAFALGFVYFSTKIWYDQEEKLASNIVKSAAFLLLAVLTVHLNLLVCFAVTALYCLFMLLKKRIRIMFAYGLGMLSAALASIALFPATIPHLFVTGELVDRNGYPFLWQIKIYWAFIQHDIIGFRNSIWPELTGMYIMLTILGICAVAIPVSIVFRKDEWFIRFKNKLVEVVTGLFRKIKCFQFPILVLFLTVFFVIVVEAKVTNISDMALHSRRYLFNVYACYACFILLFAYYPLKWISKSKRVQYLLSVLAMCICMVKVTMDKVDAFYFKYNKEGVQLADIEDEANVIISVDNAFLLTCATYKLMDKGSFYATSSNALYTHGADTYYYEGVKEKPLYFATTLNRLEQDSSDDKSDRIIDTGDDDEYFSVTFLSAENSEEETWYQKKIQLTSILDTIRTGLGAKELVEVGKDSLFGRKVGLYRVVFE